MGQRINGAIIAGNPPNQRVARLRTFWEGITSRPFDLIGGELGSLMVSGDIARGFVNQISTAIALAAGACGFFQPRIPNPWFHPLGTAGATSYYDTRQLKATLESLVDFERVNSEHANPRLSLGAVNVRSGNLIYFDSPTHMWTALHGKHYFGASNDLVGCGHMSGLSMRSICPLALMEMVWGERRRCDTFGAV